MQSAVSFCGLTVPFLFDSHLSPTTCASSLPPPSPSWPSLPPSLVPTCRRVVCLTCSRPLPSLREQSPSRSMRPTHGCCTSSADSRGPVRHSGRPAEPRYVEAKLRVLYRKFVTSQSLTHPAGLFVLCSFLLLFAFVCVDLRCWLRDVFRCDDPVGENGRRV